MKLFLGVDVGSVSTNMAFVDEAGEVSDTLYLRTDGNPIRAIQDGLRTMAESLRPGDQVAGAGSTGSARLLAGVMLGADVVKNEITAHAVAALKTVPDVQTVIEIGGQDSKIIIIRDGVVVDFAMNTVCAAGTGSFLDHQAARLKIPIEEFGAIALRARHPVRIAGRCGVFAESDMIHKQQAGHSMEDIIAGLCEALVRNYLNNVARGKPIHGPVVFQGGVAANAGIRAAFEKTLGQQVIVPREHGVMGAIGAAILAKEATEAAGAAAGASAGATAVTGFKGFTVSDVAFRTTSFDCKACANQCEVVQFWAGRTVAARWGDRCGKWSQGGGRDLPRAASASSREAEAPATVSADASCDGCDGVAQA